MNNFSLYKRFWISSLPPHLSIQLTENQIVEILAGGGYGIRNTYDFDCEKTNFWYVIKDSFGGMEELSTKIRTKVRKSLKTYEFRKVSGEELLKVALPIFNSAIDSYKVKANKVTQEELDNRIYHSMAKGDGEFWLGFERETGTAVCLAINTLEQDCCNYNTMKCNPKYMRNSSYPYYGLIYEMNKYYLETLGLKYVNDGARSITNHSNIQQMLEEVFNFRKAYCKLQIEYQWWFALIVKLLFPFRRIIPSHQIRAILNMEQMKRENI